MVFGTPSFLGKKNVFLTHDICCMNTSLCKVHSKIESRMCFNSAEHKNMMLNCCLIRFHSFWNTPDHVMLYAKKSLGTNVNTFWFMWLKMKDQTNKILSRNYLERDVSINVHWSLAGNRHHMLRTRKVLGLCRV